MKIHKDKIVCIITNYVLIILRRIKTYKAACHLN